MTKGKAITKNKTFEKIFEHTYGEDGKCIYCGYEKHTNDKTNTHTAPPGEQSQHTRSCVD